MLARIKHAEGDEVGAREMMHLAEQLAARTESTAMDDFGVALSQATLYIAQGDLESARAWAESRGLNKNVALLAQEIEGDSISSTIRRYEMLVLARLMIVQNRPRDALTLLDLVLARMEREGRIETAIEIQILRALAFQAAGDSAQALAAVERALTLAEPSGYIRTFADEGEPMRLLLQRIKDDDKGMKEYLGKLLAAFGTKNHVHPSSFSPQPLLEPLSERELEVLRLLAAGLSNPDIARELYIAVSTVRSHAKSIYGKLNVHGRWEAAQRAQELGLL